MARRDGIRGMRKTELHQHLDGSIPPRTIWAMMRRHALNPVPTLHEMQRLLSIQPGEEGTLLAYLDKFHYPMWITQFYENIQAVTEAIVAEAARNGVRTLELRYSPIIHTFAGLTPGQIGIYQINVNVPQGVTQGLSVPLTVSQGTNSSTVYVRVVQ